MELLLVIIFICWLVFLKLKRVTLLDIFLTKFDRNIRPYQQTFMSRHIISKRFFLRWSKQIFNQMDGMSTEKVSMLGVSGELWVEVSPNPGSPLSVTSTQSRPLPSTIGASSRSVSMVTDLRGTARWMCLFLTAGLTVHNNAGICFVGKCYLLRFSFSFLLHSGMLPQIAKKC